jgi:predicted small integral membrane protein
MSKYFFSAFTFLLALPAHAQTPEPTILLPNPSGIASFEELFGTIVQWLTTLLVPVLAIIIIYGGFQMLTARDNETQFKKGKKTITYAVVGAAVILVANGIILVIESFLKVQ